MTCTYTVGDSARYHTARQSIRFADEAALHLSQVLNLPALAELRRVSTTRLRHIEIGPSWLVENRVLEILGTTDELILFYL